LFLDEPFEAIDPVTAKIMRDLLPSLFALPCSRYRAARPAIRQSTTRPECPGSTGSP